MKPRILTGLILAILLACASAAAKITVSGGNYQYSNGNPVDGYLQLDLPGEESIIAYTGIRVLAPRTVRIPLVSGAASSVQIWSNCELSPSESWYYVSVWTAAGVQVNQNTAKYYFTQANGSTVNLSTMQAGAPETLIEPAQGSGSNGARGSLWYEDAGAPGTISGQANGDL